MEVLRVVGYSPGTRVDFGSSRYIHSVNDRPGRDSRESLGTRGVHAETFADDRLHVGELLSGRCVNLVVCLIAAADLMAEFVVC